MNINSQKCYATAELLHAMELIDCETFCVGNNNNHIANVLGI